MQADLLGSKEALERCMVRLSDENIMVLAEEDVYKVILRRFNPFVLS